MTDLILLNNKLRKAGFIMKKALIFTRTGMFLCILGILLVVINYFTDFINAKLTMGASLIVVIALLIALYNLLLTDRQLKNNNKKPMA